MEEYRKGFLNGDFGEEGVSGIMVSTKLVFQRLRIFILTGIGAEPKVAGRRFICSLDSGISLRLPHRDDAYFETLDDPAGCFGGGCSFPGSISCSFLCN